MVESEAKEHSEEVMLDCVMNGHNEIKKIIVGINDLVEEAGKEVIDLATKLPLVYNKKTLRNTSFVVN